MLTILTFTNILHDLEELPRLTMSNQTLFGPLCRAEESQKLGSLEKHSGELYIYAICSKIYAESGKINLNISVVDSYNFCSLRKKSHLILVSPSYAQSSHFILWNFYPQIIGWTMDMSQCKYKSTHCSIFWTFRSTLSKFRWLRIIV